jgi:hypothetical protein
MPKISFSDCIGLAGIVFAIVLVVLDKAGKLKGGWLYGLLCVAGIMTLFLAVGNEWVMDAPAKWSIWRGALMVCLVGLAYSGIAIWIEPKTGKENNEGVAAPTQTAIVTPSLLFVMGTPLGDNQSEKWIMLIQHYGPNRAYDCHIEFIDNDRKNIEHEWLVKHPNTPFLPQGMFDASKVSVKISEAGPEPTTAGNFPWTPLDPNRQHYLINISCRDGYFVEHWEVTRIDGVLRSKITVEHGPHWIQNNPGLSPIVFQFQDPEFIPQPLLAEIPKEKTAKVVHPGWKPNYRMEVPVAIIDPNGNIQMMSGVKLPDGSTRTDFGSWNFLVKHFGDTSAKQQ